MNEIENAKSELLRVTGGPGAAVNKMVSRLIDACDATDDPAAATNEVHEWAQKAPLTNTAKGMIARAAAARNPAHIAHNAALKAA